MASTGATFLPRVGAATSRLIISTCLSSSSAWAATQALEPSSPCSSEPYQLNFMVRRGGWAAKYRASSRMMTLPDMLSYTPVEKYTLS